MSPEERSLFERMMRLTEENNKILRGMKRSMMWASITRWFYWIVIIGLSVGSFYFIQPYINSLTEKLGDITGTSVTTPTTVQNDVSVLNSALDNLKALIK
jgi:hypothetical protein